MNESSINRELLITPEKKETIAFHKNSMVLSGFESNSHKSELGFDTRLRLIATAISFNSQKTENIIVSGPKIRNMSKSLAYNMKEILVNKYHIPENAVQTEENSLDTASQISWAKNNLAYLQNDVAFITDSNQEKHVQALLTGYDLGNCEVFNAEDIIKYLLPNSTHLEMLLSKYHSSPEGIKLKIRGEITSYFTKLFDPRGEALGKITKFRKLS